MFSFLYLFPFLTLLAPSTVQAIARAFHFVLHHLSTYRCGVVSSERSFELDCFICAIILQRSPGEALPVDLAMSNNADRLSGHAQRAVWASIALLHGLSDGLPDTLLLLGTLTGKQGVD